MSKDHYNIDTIHTFFSAYLATLKVLNIFRHHSYSFLEFKVQYVIKTEFSWIQ